MFSHTVNYISQFCVTSSNKIHVALICDSSVMIPKIIDVKLEAVIYMYLGDPSFM